MKAVFQHALAVDEHAGVYTPRRFSLAQFDYLRGLGEVVFHSASSCAGITMPFRTDAETVRFSYDSSMYRRSFLYFDVYENGMFCEQIRIDGKPSRGGFCYERREAGDSLIEIHLPYSCRVGISDFQAGNWRPQDSGPIDYLALGDSITLGSDSGGASLNFPSLLSRALGLNALNQGIGTYYHDPAFADRLPDLSPRLITLGYGAGDLHHFDYATSVSHIEAVHSLIRGRFPHTAVAVITPVWRAVDEENTDSAAQFQSLRSVIAQSAQKHGFFVIDGLRLTPHIPRYYHDATLHPDERGFMFYTLDCLRQLNARLPFDL